MTLLLQCLPKEPKEVNDKSYEVSKVKKKKTRASVTHPSTSDNHTSIWLTKLTTEKLDTISQTLSKSACKEMFLVVQLLLKNITSLNTHAEVQLDHITIISNYITIISSYITIISNYI